MIPYLKWIYLLCKQFVLSESELNNWKNHVSTVFYSDTTSTKLTKKICVFEPAEAKAVMKMELKEKQTNDHKVTDAEMNNEYDNTKT